MTVKNISNPGNTAKYNLSKYVFEHLEAYYPMMQEAIGFQDLKLRADSVKIALAIFNEPATTIVSFKFKTICLNSIFLVLIPVALALDSIHFPLFLMFRHVQFLKLPSNLRIQ